MPNEPEKNQMPTNKATIHTTHQLPIDLANKVIVKPANDKMSIQSTTFRTIQQPPQMRVVRMPGTGGTGAQIIQTQIMPQTILKPSIPGRSTITVSKSPATYLPRVTATLNTIQGAKGTQQIRTPTPPTSVAGISPAFVRAMTPRTSSPNAVLSQGTAWVSGAVQVPQQLLRSTITQNRTFTANIFGQTAQNQNSTVSVSTSTSGTSGQPTYVATVLPQRQPGATIVYTSQQQQPFLQGQMQRMGIATATANTRQIRPIQRIGGTTGIRVNTSTLSIRQNVPGLAPTSQVLSSQNRNTTGMTSSTTISNTIPARIFQVQPQQGSGPQVIGQSNSKILSANVMLPIIVGNQRITHSVKNPLQQGIIAHVSKLTSGTVSSDGTMISTLTNTMPSVSNTIQQATIQATQSVQVSQGNQQQTIYTTQTPQQVTNIGNQSGNQIITVSQQQQLLSNQQGNIHQGGNIQTVVPLALGSRTGNIPIKTITVSTSNSGSMDNTVTVHRSLPSNAGNLQATTIMPIAKLVSQQQMVNQQHQQNLASGQGTPVYIHTRIPAASTVASSAQSQMISTISSSSTPSYSSAPTTTVYYEQASLSTSSGSDNKTSSTSVNDYSVGSTANIRYSSDKLIHSIIANSFQNQNAQNTSHMQQQQSSAVQQQSVPIRFSPLVVEGQSGQQGQQTSHQIITMGTSNIVQQQGPSGSETPTHMIVPLSSQVPTSPRGAGSILRKHNETTPQKGVKKQPKVKNYQVITEPLQTRVQPRQPIAAGVAQLTQNLKPIEVKQPSVASSPKTTFSERESPSHVDEWSDGSTTVSIPNSPRSEDDDLDAMIQFNKIGEEFAKLNKIGEEFAKFNKTPIKLGGGMKRDAGDHPMTPRSVKKIKL